jgi:hypothetical protein
MYDISVIDFEDLPLQNNLNDLDLAKWKEIGDQVYKACSEYGNKYFKLVTLVFNINLFRLFLC